jgi:hypothetical protein
VIPRLLTSPVAWVIGFWVVLIGIALIGKVRQAWDKYETINREE